MQRRAVVVGGAADRVPDVRGLGERNVAGGVDVDTDVFRAADRADDIAARLLVQDDRVARADAVIQREQTARDVRAD